MILLILMFLLTVTAGPKRRRGVTQWLTLREAADYSRLKIRTLRGHIDRGSLRAFIPRGSRVLLIDQRDLEDFLSGEERP